ncbi:MAG: D-Ala-D-Ala carboxypeptidase family metallohydrolase [Pseudomonadales bacterium]
MAQEPVAQGVCGQPADAQLAPPPGLRINGEAVIGRLTSVMDTDSKPLTIDYPDGGYDDPLELKLPDPDDNAHLLQLTSQRWVYSPGRPLYLGLASSAESSRTQPKVRLLDICAGDYHARVQVWMTEYSPDLAERYPNPYKSPLPHKYDTPINFIQITSPDEAEQQLSSHFKVSQFLPVKPDRYGDNTWPQPLLIQMPLLEKLEAVLDVLAEHGKPAATLKILSGYRTPRHNKRVGGASYSRHMYGDAVDFIVDTNDDGKMDDLNGDGKVSRADLSWLLKRLAGKPVPLTAGGTGAYESHGKAEAFLHMDARGRTAYWQ